jgi:hypothetical protein
LKHEGRETTFTLKEKTIVRVDGMNHEQLSVYFKILKDNKVIATQEGKELQNTDLILHPSIFVVLEPGNYVLKIEFVARESELLRAPCQSIQL